MKRPNKFTVNPDSYLTSDIDPLLDELQQLRNAEPFPTREEFEKWWMQAELGESVIESMYDYFAQFKTRTIEVMPEVGREYEATTVDGRTISGELMGFFIGSDEAEYCKSIRPITTPTRDEVIAKCKALGLSDSEIEVLGGKS
jgi:hypothetical protein